MVALISALHNSIFFGELLKFFYFRELKSTENYKYAVKRMPIILNYLRVDTK